MSKIKIGVRAHDIGLNYTDEIIAYCHENLIDGLQLVVNKTWPETYKNRDVVEITKNISLLRENNIDIYLLGCYFNPLHSNKKFLNEELNRVKFNINIANINSIEYIGSETGSVNNDEWTYDIENHSDSSLDKVANIFTSFSNELNNVSFLIEPVYEHTIYDIQRLEKLQQKIDNKFLTTLDLANLLNDQNVDNYITIFEDALKSQGNKIKLFHFKNFTITNGQKIATSLQNGVINYEKILKIIKKNDKIDIPIIIEELSGNELIESIKFIREMEKQWK